MNAFLPPIERSKSFVMKLVYYFSKKRLGKVIMPLKVHSARLPVAFGLFYAKVGELDKKLTLPKELTLLIRQQVLEQSQNSYLDCVRFVM